MAKNPSKKAVGKDEPMNGAMKFFLAGCVAELYLLILRRFYVNAGSDVARFAWYDHYLWILAGIGAGVMAVVRRRCAGSAERPEAADGAVDRCGSRTFCGRSRAAGALEHGNAVLPVDRGAGHHDTGDPLGAV